MVSSKGRARERRWAERGLPKKTPLPLEIDATRLETWTLACIEAIEAPRACMKKNGERKQLKEGLLPRFPEVGSCSSSLSFLVRLLQEPNAPFIDLPLLSTSQLSSSFYTRCCLRLGDELLTARVHSPRLERSGFSQEVQNSRGKGRERRSNSHPPSPVISPSSSPKGWL